MRKKAIALLLVAAMAIGTMVGCGKQESASGSTSASDSEQADMSSGNKEEQPKETASSDENIKIADGDITLTIYCAFQDAARAHYKDLGDNPVVQKIEEMTGLNLEFIHAPAGDDGSFFQQLLASGEYPDLFATSEFQTKYPGGVEGAVKDGIIMNVDDLIEEYATNFNRWVEESDDPLIQNKIRSDSGSIIKFGTIWLPPFDDGKTWYGMMVRKDLLDKYNLEAPVTIDEYTNVLRTFKENGVKVPLAISAFTEAAMIANNPIASAYGVSVNDFQLDDSGNVHYSRTLDGYKDFLVLLNSWAKEGLIDNDFISRKLVDSTKLFQNGTAGMVFEHSITIKGDLTAGKAIDPDFDLVACEYPKVNKDDELHLTHVVSSVNSFSWQVASTSKHPVEAVKFVDFLMNDDVVRMTAWGTEDSGCYTEDEEGNRTYTDFVLNNPDGLEYGTMRDLYACSPLQIKYDQQQEEQMYTLPQDTGSWAIWQNNNDNAWRLPAWLTLSTEEAGEVADIKAKLNNYSDEMVYKFIFGEASIDNEWDTFVKTLKDLGSERAEAVYKDAYDRYQSRTK
ncbi:extracellular solute-binding protein [Eisenbergiella tayi]|uniref:extracellular solute-binding protein n=1 Tax=Eisenbergiella tayi TaxID=1432052 RepID=UPI0008492E42|nr:extracellular solute-binding protein [Eisenbergiella tayi]ODR43331.1 hypothetical protein BEI60_00610 [Eisenbergiella tayi]